MIHRHFSPAKSFRLITMPFTGEVLPIGQLHIINQEYVYNRYWVLS